MHSELSQPSTQQSQHQSQIPKDDITISAALSKVTVNNITPTTDPTSSTSASNNSQNHRKVSVVFLIDVMNMSMFINLNY